MNAVKGYTVVHGSLNTTGALSTRNSIDKALPAISANSWPGSRDRMSVATRADVEH